MNWMWIIGLLMFAASGAVLHDVPFLRYMAALLLISFGTVLGMLSH